ncbi:MAG: hypothetical protein A370_00738 [Clostridium sp. Maddingley MBC34-26]|nr:CbrC family protein [Clostridium sp. LS]EKQ57606.1 MAG: hypothetical protein A370_00738 [Clostridium sp. Maddingley MBC34-26]
MNVFSKSVNGQTLTCQCCKKKNGCYLEMMYCEEDIVCICPECVSSGKAAEKFNGTFIQDAEFDKVDSLEKIDELMKRTPGYISWQGEHWLACCNDFCQYIGEVGVDDLKKMGIAEQVISDYERDNPDSYYEDCMEYLGNGIMQGYLFKCLECGKYRLWVDSD